MRLYPTLPVHVQVTLRTWREAVHGKSAAAWLAALLLAGGIAVVEADMLVPLFWDRRVPSQLAFLLGSALFQTTLLVDAVARFAADWSAEREPTPRFSRIVVAVGLGLSLLAVMIQAALAFGPDPAPVETRALLAAAGGPEGPVIWGYLAALASLLWLAYGGAGLKRLSTAQRRSLPLIALAICLAVVYLIDNLQPLVDMERRLFTPPNVVRSLHPIGRDFRVGIRLPAERLIAGEEYYPFESADTANVYPPLTVIMGLPYLLVPVEEAYVLHVLLIAFAALAGLVLTAMLASRAAGGSERRRDGHDDPYLIATAILVGAMLLSGYPFLFSVERGNVDAIAHLFSLLSIGVLLRSPQRKWLQVVLLSIAIHIKVYPALLLVVLMMAHGRRIVWPVLLTNAALLLCLGPRAAWQFITTLLTLYTPHHAVFNHSSASFSHAMSALLAANGAGEAALVITTTGLVLGLWFAGLRTVQGWEDRPSAVLCALLITLPPMALLPMRAHDYRLVILYAGFLLFFVQHLRRMEMFQTPADYLQLLIASACLLLIGRSYMLMPGAPEVLQNKFPWVFVFQILGLVHVLQISYEERSGGPRQDRRASKRGSRTVRSGATGANSARPARQGLD